MDEDSFRDFVQTRLSRLSRVAYLLTGDHHAAEDLLQNALAKLASRWKQMRKDGNVDAYLRKILYHEHISAWRRVKFERSHADVPEPEPGPDQMEASIRRIVIE